MCINFVAYNLKYTCVNMQTFLGDKTIEGSVFYFASPEIITVIKPFHDLYLLSHLNALF